MKNSMMNNCAVYPNQSSLQAEDDFNLIDTHCHLDLEPLYSHLPQTLEAARRARVTSFVVPGVHPEGWERIAGLAQRHPDVYPAFGVHPMHADLVDDEVMERLGTIASAGVAMGEIGLDRSYSVPMETQEEAFRKQLRLAIALDLPVLVHCRRAFQRTLRILQEEKCDQVGGIMHAFSGSVEMAREFIRLGFAISLSGTVTWDNAVRPLRLAKEIPLSSLVLETDSPDLAPQAFRGESNQPARLVEMALAAAKIRGMLLLNMAHAAEANSRRILKKIPLR